jgi:hypothetical protein
MDRCGSHIFLNTVFSKTLRILDVLFCIAGGGEVRIVRICWKWLIFGGFEFVVGIVFVFGRVRRRLSGARPGILRTV